jgi:hypothetical protein
MSTMTAQLLIGEAHPYDGGINPTHSIFLSENSVPRFILSSLQSSEDKVIWLPTVEHMLEDALLMVALHVWKDEKLLQMAKQFFRKNKTNHILLYEDIDAKALELMRERTRQLDGYGKITISVFRGSTVHNQVAVLKGYRMDVEVCMPIYVREYSVWTKQTESIGSLEEKMRL